MPKANHPDEGAQFEINKANTEERVRQIRYEVDREIARSFGALAPIVCDAVAHEDAFCQIKPWRHQHRCTMTHREGAGGITLHKCGCGAEFYFLEEAMQVLVAKVFGDDGSGTDRITDNGDNETN